MIFPWFCQSFFLFFFNDPFIIANDRANDFSSHVIVLMMHIFSLDFFFSRLVRFQVYSQDLYDFTCSFFTCRTCNVILLIKYSHGISFQSVTYWTAISPVEHVTHHFMWNVYDLYSKDRKFPPKKINLELCVSPRKHMLAVMRNGRTS